MALNPKTKTPVSPDHKPRIWASPGRFAIAPVLPAAWWQWLRSQAVARKEQIREELVK
jgi:hypothetical protein